jgi:hypothetical protein
MFVNHNHKTNFWECSIIYNYTKHNFLSQFFLQCADKYAWMILSIQLTIKNKTMVVPFTGSSGMAIASEPISSRQPLCNGLAEDAVEGFY